MTFTASTLAIEISNALAATDEDYTAKVVDLGVYGTSCEITKHGSNKTLHLTPVDDSLIDMALFGEAGDTIATGTLFNKAVADITPEELSNLVEICL